MKLSIFILAFLLITFLYLWCHARQSEQFCTTKGSVFDEQNKPLPFANVFLKGRDPQLCSKRNEFPGRSVTFHL